MCSDTVDNTNLYKSFKGDNRIRHHIVFERGTYMECVFCGTPSDTREHSPSKVFLSSPYPTDLPTVPSCKKCNNSFSSDELYTALLLELLKAEFYGEKYEFSKDTLKRLSVRGEGSVAKETFQSLHTERRYSFADKRLERVLVKLAICHATHELSDGYFCNSWNGASAIAEYYFLPELNSEEIDAMNAIEPMDNKFLPEVGSIGYDHIYLMDSVLSSVDSRDNIKIRIPFLFWSEIQEGKYRYMCYWESNQIHVKIVIDEFLFAHIVLKSQN